MKNKKALPDATYLALARAHSTPFYLTYEDELRSSLACLGRAVSGVGRPVHIAYSYKTNNLARMCALYRDLGAWAEVTPEIEYTMARHLGVEPTRIVVNGPYKPPEALRSILHERAILFIDSFEELKEVAAIAQGSPPAAPFCIGLRVSSLSPEIGWNKFGFSIESKEIFQAAQLIKESQHLSLTDIHVHFRSKINRIADYERAMSLLGEAVSELLGRRLLARLRFLDVGSGFAVASPVPTWAKTWSVPQLSEYGQVLRRLSARLPAETELIIEPGRVLTGRSMDLVARVQAVKMRGETALAIVDAGTNNLGDMQIRHPISLVSASADSPYPIPCLLHGPLCYGTDTLTDEALPFLPSVGDLVVIHAVGAYDFARGFSWSCSRAKVLWMDQHADIKEIVPPDHLVDIWRHQL